jgi:hypothetical protein
LQELLAKYPNLLAGDQIDSDEPRRWLLVSRKVPLASEEDGVGRWSVDHLFLDQDAIPTIVEVKRSTDTRIRREVVGQMLDYAANAVAYWPVETLRSRFEENSEDPEQDLRELLDDETVSEEFWQRVKANLQAGKLRLIFIADEIPAELRRVVEFLNQQMDPVEVLAVEIKQYAGGDLKTLVLRVIGQTVEAQQKKTGNVGEPSEKMKAYRVFFQSLIDQLRENHNFTKARAGQLQNWYSFASGFSGISYSFSFTKGGQVRAEIYVDHDDRGANKALFDDLAKQKDLLSAQFGEELEWDRLDNRRASRIATYRGGSIEDDMQTLKDIEEWAIDRLLRLKKVFAPKLAEIVG